MEQVLGGSSLVGREVSVAFSVGVYPRFAVEPLIGFEKVAGKDAVADGAVRKTFFNGNIKAIDVVILIELEIASGAAVISGKIVDLTEIPILHRRIGNSYLRFCIRIVAGSSLGLPLSHIKAYSALGIRSYGITGVNGCLGDRLISTVLLNIKESVFKDIMGAEFAHKERRLDINSDFERVAGLDIAVGRLAVALIKLEAEVVEALIAVFGVKLLHGFDLVSHRLCARCRCSRDECAVEDGDHTRKH